MANWNDTQLPSYTLEEAKKLFPPIWVIYDHPRDFPGHIVVRVAYGLTKDPTAVPCASLVEAREYAVTQGASGKLDRFPDDDPTVIEMWI